MCKLSIQKNLRNHCDHIPLVGFYIIKRFKFNFRKMLLLIFFVDLWPTALNPLDKMPSPPLYFFIIILFSIIGLPEDVKPISLTHSLEEIQKWIKLIATRQWTRFTHSLISRILNKVCYIPETWDIRTPSSNIYINFFSCFQFPNLNKMIPVCATSIL